MKLAIILSVIFTIYLGSTETNAQGKQQLSVLVISAWSDESARYTATRLREAIRTISPEKPVVQFDFKWIQFKGGRHLGPLPDLSRYSIVFAESCDVARVLAVTENARVPIVFTGYCDPVKHGIVQRLDDPHRLITGVATYRSIDAKIVQLLVDAVPGLQKIAFIYDPSENSGGLLPLIALALKKRGIEFLPVVAEKFDPPANVLARLLHAHVDGIVFSKTEFYVENSRLLPRLVSAAGLLSVAEDTAHARLGGLMGMRSRSVDPYVSCAVMIRKILDGTPPAAIPIVQPRGTEIVMNVQRLEDARDRVNREFLILVDRFVLSGADAGGS